MQALRITPRTEPESAALRQTRENLRLAVEALQHVTCPKARADAVAKLKQTIIELQDKGI